MNSHKNSLRRRNSRVGKIIEAIFLVLIFLVCLPAMLFGNWFVTKYSKYATKPAVAQSTSHQTDRGSVLSGDDDAQTVAFSSEHKHDGASLDSEELHGDHASHDDDELHSAGERLADASDATDASRQTVGSPYAPPEKAASVPGTLPAPLSNVEFDTTDESEDDTDAFRPSEAETDAAGDDPMDSPFAESDDSENPMDGLDDLDFDDDTVSEQLPPMPRTWTLRSGRKAKATFMRVESGIAILSRDNREFKIPLRLLSDDDQSYVESQR